MVHQDTLSEKQFTLIRDHLAPAVERMIGRDETVLSGEIMTEELARKGHDYDGSSYVVMEDIDKEKVLACWPTASEAAIAPLEDFLEGETRRLVLTPGATILPEEEWPEKIPQSYVRATDETWQELIAEGYKRGLFQACPDSEVLQDARGRKVLNGAGAVPKIKKGEVKQRFISIFCPLNAVSQKIEGDEGTLPYVGQVHLIQVPEESEIIIDSEDMASAFNLFRMPLGWRGMFVYEKKVPASCLGLPGEEPTYVALRTVPMGWVSAVGTVQAAIRHLAFKEAGLPLKSEVQKWQEMPKDSHLFVYLDSVDQLQVVSRTMAAILKGTESPEHARFRKACEKKGLPTNASKMLAGALQGSLQGGEVVSEAGVFQLHGDKMRLNIAAALHLLNQEKWAPNEAAGVLGRMVFAAAFRRPILSMLEDSFQLLQNKGAKVEPSVRMTDEMLTMVAMIPLAFTNLKAPIHSKLSATDASPTGAGSCVAQQLKRPPHAPDINMITCLHCREDIAELIGNGADIECPFGCGGRLCSLECFLEHQEGCKNSQRAIPLFSERWSGPNAPLSRAVLQEGLDVTWPYDRRRDESMDFFTEAGKETWNCLDALDVKAEHHAPDCKTMSRARGKPFKIRGKWVSGPPALRDANNVLGFKNLTGQNAVRVRQGNRMALRSVDRCAQLDDDGKIFTLEHPWRSWLWYMRKTVELASRPGVYMAVFANCCHGGRRQKWTAVLTNSEEVFEELHRPECSHGVTDDFTPYEDQQGYIVFPTEEEAEYPEGMCQAIARGLRKACERRDWFPPMDEHRVKQLCNELGKYSRFEDESLKLKVAHRIYELESNLVTGYEEEALQDLLRHGHYRGTDIRLFVEHNNVRELVPYPAYRWLWRDTLSFRWKNEGHINELEGQALIAHVRRLLREPGVKHLRMFIVVDSQVLYFSMGKGRSPSKRLNKLLKRLACLCLMADLYIFGIWTLSAWNHADIPSRRA